MQNPVLFELAREGRGSRHLPDLVTSEEKILASIPPSSLRKSPLRLPEIAELDLARHLERLTDRNHYIEKDLYPLGSCTMKYNPKLHEKLASHPLISGLHPGLPDEEVQGAIQLLVELEECLQAITGMDDVTLQPAAGAHGEFTSMRMIEAYYRDRGESRTKVITPDSAHGTNPASIMRVGWTPVEAPHNERGEVDLEALGKLVDGSTAALMLTLPNTLGLFETQLPKIVEIVHSAGAQMYLDGANLNALLGFVRPGDVGFDVMHINVHKTFSTPHGGGGPGAGPVGVKKHLTPYLPSPRPVKSGDVYHWDRDLPDSIGPVHSHFGNFGILLRAFAYIRHHGSDGLREVQRHAILNANYLMKRIADSFPPAFDRTPMHEFVSSAARYRDRGIRAGDIGKRLLDFGFYAPTIAFPLIVKEALMIEPTETESPETLDRFADAMNQIAAEIESDPEMVKTAPHNTPVKRVNDSLASRKPILRWPDDAPTD